MVTDLDFLKVVVLPGVTLTSFELPEGRGPDPRRKIKLRLMTTHPDAGRMCDMMLDEDCEVFITVRKKSKSSSGSGLGIPHEINPHI